MLLDTTITAVTVYTDRARVTRRGEIMLEAGEQTIVLTNLPKALDEDSVRVSGRGAGIEILSVEVKTVYHTEPKQEGVATLSAQITDLELQDYALFDEDKDLESQLALLDAARDSGGETFAKEIAIRNATVDELNTYARYIKDEQSRIRALRREIMVKRKKIIAEIDAIKHHIVNYQQYREELDARREIRILVSADAPTNFEVETIYAVRYCSWQPYYDIRLKEEEVELVYFATVTQRSGEDWSEVDMALSTARPALTSVLPKLPPEYMNIREHFHLGIKEIVFGLAGMAKGIVDSRRESMRPRSSAGHLEMRSAEPKVESQQTTVEQGVGAALTYRIPTPVTVPSDGTPHKTTVTIQKLSAKLDYLTIPKLAEEVYLRAKITNTSAYTLLPGVVSIFHGSEFVGKTSIKTIAPNEEFEAQLGVDDRMKVKRELLQRDVAKKFIGSSRQVQFAYKITLTNLSESAAKITINDQLPLSTSDRIQVKLLSATPAITEQDKLNILEWVLTLKPNEKQEITFSYVVEHPKDMEIIG